MTRFLLFATLCGGSACAGGYSSPGTPPAPAPAAAARPTPKATLLVFTPGTMRYLWHQDVHTESDFAGMPPISDRRYSLYITVAIAEPADSIGYLTSFTVDSVTVDSGSQFPPQFNLRVVKGFRMTGRLTFTGEFRDLVPSDPATVASVGCLLPRFHSFFPRLPLGGIHPDTAWTDSTSTTDNYCGTTVSYRSLNQRVATAWEDHGGVRALPLAVTASYAFTGSGEQSGSSFTMSGTGMGTSRQILAGDGRYLGSESRDSTTVTIDITPSGVSIPQRQITRTTVTVLPN